MRLDVIFVYLLLFADYIRNIYKGDLIPVFPQRMRRDMGMGFFAVVPLL